MEPDDRIFSSCVRCILPGAPGVALKFAMLPLFVLAMVGSAVLAKRFKEASRGRAMVIATIVSGLLFVAIPIGLVSDWPAARYSPLVITGSGAFEWPPRCVKKTYNVGDSIDMACKQRQNALSRRLVLDHSFRFTNSRGDVTYYCVGSDAVLPACNYFYDTCTVSWVEHNVFR